MKLISLEIEGLNSFKNKTTIDFKSLFDKGFFGIFGATGSGKSSILDSIFFALYGKVLRVKNDFEFINLKKRKASATLTFEMLSGGENKVFEVSRSYKFGAEKQIIKSAKIAQLDGDDRITIAEGNDEVTEKIKEIVGFDEEQFRRFIALPQGQFSQFLKDSPRSKIETMAKVFDLDGYGQKFADNLSSLRSENLKRKAYLTGVLEQYAHVDERVIQGEEKQLHDFERQSESKEKELFVMKEDFLSAQNDFELIKEKKKLDEKLKELKEKQAEINDDTQKVAVMKAIFAIHPLFSRLKSLKEEKENLQIELDKLTDEISATNTSYIKIVAANDKQKTQLSVKLAELERRQSLLLAIRADAERYQALEKQKNALDGQIKDETLALEKLKDIYDTHSLSLENNLRIIADLDQFLTKNEISGSVITAAREFEKLKSYADILKLSLDDLTAEKNRLGERKNVLLKSLVENDESLNSFKSKIAKANETLKEMFDGETSFEKATVTATNKLAFLKLQGTDYIEILVEIDNLKNQATKLLAKIKNEDEVQKGLNLELESVQSDIEEQASLEVIDKERIKALKAEQKKVKEKILDSKQNRILLHEKRDFILNQINKLAKKQKEFLAEDELFKDLTLEKLEGKILSAENTVYRLVELAGSLEKAKESASAKERACVKISAQIEEISKKEGELTAKISETNDTILKAQEKLDKFEALNKEGLLKNAKAYDENFNSQIVILGQQKGVIPQIIKFVDLKQKAADKYFDAKAKLNEKQIKFEQIGLDMKVILNKLRSLNVKGYIKDEIANNFSNIDSVRETLKNITDSEGELLKRETKLKIQKAAVISALVLKEEEVEGAQDQLAGECKLAGVTEGDLMKEIVYDDITELEQKINEFNTEKAQAIQDANRLSGQIANKRITQTKLLEMKENLDKCEKAHLNLQSEMAFLEKQIAKDKANVKKLSYFKQELEEVDEKEKNFARLAKLNDGDAILKFITEEYILQITEKANTYFGTLTNGRFQLIFANDFLVVDNLNGGLTRSVGTLSGGETFLASLSLAIAIVEVVSLLHNKPLDFVFLDEGFGTLDENSIEMVMTALRRLRETKLVFGLITHEELVKFKTPTRIEVYKSAEEGSRVQTVL